MRDRRIGFGRMGERPRKAALLTPGLGECGARRTGVQMLACGIGECPALIERL